jgi:metallo-beta-lactamase class B
VTVAYSGGTLTGAFGTDGARWDEYIASQKKIARVAADAAATVMLSNHSEYDGAYTKARLAGLKREVEKGIRLSSALKAFSITSP